MTSMESLPDGNDAIRSMAASSEISAIEVIEVLRQLKKSGHIVIVGVDGCGGSGKSTFARALVAAAPSEISIVQMDDFYKPSSERPTGSNIGGNFDWERVRDSVLVPLREGRIARYQRYDWPTDKLAESHEVQPKGIVIIEGVYSTRAELRGFYDFRVFVECPFDVRLERGIDRDGEVAREKWVTLWMPAEAKYMVIHRPSDEAHLKIDGSSSPSAGMFRMARNSQ